MRRRILLFLLAAVLLVLARLSLFTVDRTDFVYLTRFGSHVATFDGANADESGLHVKWPWPIESALRVDRRLQTFDLPGAELLTHDPRGKTIDKTLTIDAYVCWDIPDKTAVDRFLRTIGTPDRARTILGQRISSDLGAAIGQMELDDLISIEPGRVDRQRDTLRRRLLDNQREAGLAIAGEGLRERARQEYGIEIVDIRLRRTNHPPQVREAIFERIRSERNKKVADYRSEGEKLAKDIESAAARRVRDVLATARADEQRLKGQADAEADRIRNEAHAMDPQFYAFLKKLEEYQRILGDNRSVLLLSTHRELFDLLLKPPRPESAAPPKAGTAGPMTLRDPKKGGQ